MFSDNCCVYNYSMHRSVVVATVKNGCHVSTQNENVKQLLGLKMSVIVIFMTIVYIGVLSWQL